MKLFFKMLRKLKQAVRLQKYKMQYGDDFQFGHISLRGRLYVYLEDGAKCKISSAFFNNDCSINCHKEITIGENCLFGENVKLYDHDHIFKSKDTPFSKQGFKTSKIVIGNNVWIGSNCIILKGTTIGDNVAIGANCVISGDIPAESIVRQKASLSIEKIHFIENN